MNIVAAGDNRCQSDGVVFATIILLGGGVIDMDGYPRDTLTQRVFGALPHAGSIHSIDIRWATLGWQAAIFGAVRLGDMLA